MWSNKPPLIGVKRSLRSQTIDLRDERTTLMPPTQPTLSTCCLAWEAEHIATYIRPEDKREIEAALPLDVQKVIEESWKQTATGGVIRIPARVMAWEPIAIFGLVPIVGLAHAARPWLLATPRLERYNIRLLRIAPFVLKQMSEPLGITYLENHVHAENARAIRLIEKLGFTVEEAAPWGASGAPFRKFWKNLE